MQAFNGESSTFTTQFNESVGAALVFHSRQARQDSRVFHIGAGSSVARGHAILGRRIAARLLEQCGEEQGNTLFQRYGQTFPTAYKEDFTARTAVRTFCDWTGICATYPLDMRLYRPLEDRKDSCASRSLAPNSRFRCPTCCQCWSGWACGC